MKVKDFIDIRILFGCLLGTLTVLSIIFCVSKFSDSQPTYNITKVSPVAHVVNNDTIANRIVVDSVEYYLTSRIESVDSIYQKMSNNNSVYEEKINSINGRFNDLYVLGGIIIMLLLMINIAVSIRAKNETKIFLEDNFEGLKAEMEEHLKTAQNLVGRIEVEHSLAKRKNNTGTENNDNNDDANNDGTN